MSFSINSVISAREMIVILFLPLYFNAIPFVFQLLLKQNIVGQELIRAQLANCDTEIFSMTKLLISLKLIATKSFIR